MNGNEKLEIAEAKGRSRFEKFLKLFGFKNYSFTPLSCVYDVELTTPNGSYIVEIKHRAKKYSSYNDLLLEEKKNDSLQKIAKEKNCKILYVHTYEDSPNINIADITNKTFTFKTEKQQKSDLWNRTLIDKGITYIKDCFKFTVQ